MTQALKKECKGAPVKPSPGLRTYFPTQLSTSPENCFGQRTRRLQRMASSSTTSSGAASRTAKLHTYIHYITLQYNTLHYIHTYILTYITLHYNTIHYITNHTLTHTYIHTYMPLHYMPLHYITLHYVILHYITYITYINTYIHTYIHTYMAQATRGSSWSPQEIQLVRQASSTTCALSSKRRTPPLSCPWVSVHCSQSHEDTKTVLVDLYGTWHLLAVSSLWTTRGLGLLDTTRLWPVRERCHPVCPPVCVL